MLTVRSMYRLGIIAGLALCAMPHFAGLNPLGPGEQRYQLGIDKDNNIATGCDFIMLDGTTISGIDMVLTLNVLSTQDPPTVSGIYLQNCDSNSNTFGPSTQISDGGWPIASDLGVGGADAIEGFLPLSAFGVTSSARIVIQSEAANGDWDVMTLDANGNGTGGPIEAILDFSRTIPTLGQWGLIAFLALMMFAALWIMRRRRLGRIGLFGTVLIISLVVIAVPGVFNLDGDLSDWDGLGPLAQDPSGDALNDNVSVDLIAFFAGYDLVNLYIRLDVNDVENLPPEANDDDYSVDEGGTLDEAAPGVLVNDTDDNMDPLTVAVATDPGNGVLTLNGDGSFTYEHDGSETTTDSFTYRVFDGIAFSDPATVTITINPVNDPPTGVTIDPDNVGENQPVGTVVGTFSTADPDTGDTFTYALPAGQLDNDQFTLSTDQLLTAAIFDHETNDTFTIRVESTDSGMETVSEDIVITVNDGNDAPTSVTLTATSVDENQSANTLIGTLGTLDPDAGDSHVYSLPAGVNDNDLFLIGNTDELRTGQVFDHEAQDMYNITVRTDDQETRATFEQDFVISINDINDDPTAIILDDLTVDENTPNALVGNLSSTDQDTADTHTYSLVAGTGDTDNTQFQVVGSQLQASGTLDFETQDMFSVRLQTDDGNGGAFQQTFNLTANDLNDPPTAVAISPNNVDENQPAGTVVGTFSTTDPDSGDTFTYALPAGQLDNDQFTVNGDQLETAGMFDHETNDTFTIRVESTDSGTGMVSEDIVISINDRNDAPTAVVLSATSVDENQAANTLVGTLTTMDPDAGDSHVYSLPAGVNDNDLFLISSNELRTGQIFDHEAQDTYNITIRTDDQETRLTFDEDFVISIGDINDDPTAIALDDLTADENAANALVGNLSTTDEDTTDTHTYTLVAGTGDTDNAQFQVSGSQLQVNGTLDFETQDSFSVRLQTDDGNGGTFQQSFNLSANNLNDAPVANDDSGYSVVQGGTINGAASVLTNDTDEDAGATLTAILQSSPSNASAFTLNPDGTFDYTHDDSAGPNTDSFTYLARDNASADSNIVTVTISINLSPVGVADAASVGQGLTVTTVNGANTSVLDNDSDPEGDSITAVLQSGPANASAFNLNADGTFSYTHDGTFTNSDSFVYRAMDANTDSPDVTVTITVNLTPMGVDDVAQTLPGGTVTQLVTTETSVLANDTDPENDTLQATLVTGPTNASAFTLNADGTFSYTNDNTRGMLPPSSDSFTYRASDGLTESNVTTVTINLNQAPTFTSAGPTAATEGVLYTYNITTNDPDGNPVTISSITAPGWLSSFVDNGNGTATLSGTPTNADVGMAGNDVTLRVTDNSLLSSDQSFTINVANTNDAPTFTSAEVTAATEDAVYTYNITVTDIDADDPLTDLVITGQTLPAWLAAGLTDNGNGTATLTGTPGDADVGANNVTLRVADDNGGFTDQIFVITVGNIDDDPQLVGAIPDQNFTEGVNIGTVDLSTFFSDDDIGDTLTFTLATLPGGTGLAFDTNSGELTGTPNMTDLGASPITVTMTADDGNGGPTASDTFDINIFSAAPDLAFDVIGNSELRVGDQAGGQPSFSSGAFLQDAEDVLDGTAGLTVDPPAVLPAATDQGGSINIDAQGRFAYIPPLDFNGADTFTYDTTNGDSGVLTFNVSATKVYHVRNNFAGTEDGRSHQPFNTLAEAFAVAGAGDTIFVEEGDGTSTGLDGAFTIDENNQRLIGEGVSHDFALALNGNASPAVLKSAGNRPQITNTAGGGDAITIADVDGVELSGFDIDANNVAVQVNGTGANNVGVTISDNFIGDTTTGDGLNLNLINTGTTSVTVNDNTFSGANGTAATIAIGGMGSSAAASFSNNNFSDSGTGSVGSGFSSFVSEANFTLGFANNTNFISGGTAVNIAGGDATTITSFSNITVDPSSPGSGIFVSNSFFDADPNTNAFEVINAGTFNIGTIADGVGGSGVTITNTTGDLNFTDLEIGADGGQGLALDGVGSFDAVNGTGMRVTIPAGSNIDASAGALSLSDLTAVVTIDTLNSAGGTSGIVLSTVTGNVDVNGGAIAGSTGPALDIDNGDPTFTFDGNVTNTADRLLDVNGTTGGTVTLQSGTLSDSGAGANTGTGILLTSVAGSVTISSGLTITSSDSTGIDIQGGSGSFTFSGSPSITNPTGAAFNINGGTSPVTYNGGITQGNNAALVSITNHATGTVGFSTGALSATNGTGIQVSNGDGTYNFNGAVTLNGGDAGIDILSGSAGTFTFSNAPITNPSGAAVTIASSSATVTHTGAINNNANNSVNATNNTSGSVIFNSAITDTGAGINLTSNGTTTFDFPGALSLTTTTNAGLNADTNGSIIADNAANFITTTSGQPLRVVNTTIGAGGLIFTRIDTNGAANGIELENTGATAGITITGTGSTDGSGGTIQSITNRGASFINGINVSLNNMNFTNAATTNGADPTLAASTCGSLDSGTGGNNTACNAPINLRSVTGVTLDNLNINGSVQVGININTVTNLTLSDSVLTGIGNQTREYGVKAYDLLGTVNISNTSITGSQEDNMRVRNESATALNMTVTGSTFSSSTAQHGLLIDSQNNGNMTVDVTGSTFTGNSSDGVFGLAEDSASLDIQVSTSTFSTNGGNHVNIGQNDSAVVVFDVLNNGSVGSPMLDAGINGININMATGSTAGQRMTGTINNNFIGLAGDANSGATTGSAIRLRSNGAGTATFAVTNNTIREVQFEDGIGFIARDGSNSTNISVVGNDVNLTSFNAFEGIIVQAGASATDTVSVCTDVRNNTSASAGGDGIRVRQRFNNTTLNLERLAAATAVTGTVESHINSENAGTALANISATITIQIGAVVDDACPDPND